MGLDIYFPCSVVAYQYFIFSRDLGGTKCVVVCWIALPNAIAWEIIVPSIGGVHTFALFWLALG